MIVDETFYRGAEVGREARRLPAAVYNGAHLLVARAVFGAVFVPIRSMQYLAVLDSEEFIFVDRNRGRAIDLAWCKFAPQTRTALDEPVSYEAVFYTPDGVETMRRLQGEFALALRQIAERNAVPRSARVAKLERAQP